MMKHEHATCCLSVSLLSWVEKSFCCGCFLGCGRIVICVVLFSCSGIGELLVLSCGGINELSVFGGWVAIVGDCGKRGAFRSRKPRLMNLSCIGFAAPAFQKLWKNKDFKS